ncbi:hypothetical protein TraAM80_01596 [Trypanosoma rangeli]|uniref:Uncharacterized protein n=1 Tax=Trypanosoma rangeli TaxID=5698 RepID=A0A422NY41_TRYRA|nr:uncharacterized protein TraAM80_01596 [Trypanosoma rangeli]RNF10423.1 hypothetical protein TraAM80_01596 [Trypanosoma rangeli]|eukprot:RNF10423.1 hypothetical protein TraAM80_01596 [Trypanosoma rangeli]
MTRAACERMAPPHPHKIRQKRKRHKKGFTTILRRVGHAAPNPLPPFLPRSSRSRRGVRSVLIIAVKDGEHVLVVVEQITDAGLGVAGDAALFLDAVRRPVLAPEGGVVVNHGCVAEPNYILRAVTALQRNDLLPHMHVDTHRH